MAHHVFSGMTLSRYIRYVITAVRMIVSGNFEVSWKRLKPVDLVIWDEVGSQFLLDALGPTSYYVLRRRQHIVYFHPSIVWATLIGALTKRNTHYGIVIQQCRPRCVVTMIDNNPRFHELASKLPNVRFIAVQNGVRFPDYWDPPTSVGPPAHYDSEYLCFGQHEIDSYKALGYQFKRIEAVGSLKNALFTQYLRGSTKQFDVEARYDLVLISEFRWTDLSQVHPGTIEYEKVVGLLGSYLKSHLGLRVVVAMVTASDHPQHESEKLFHRNRLGDSVTLFSRSDDAPWSYHLTEQSNVNVVCMSTLGFESLARGRKTLLCASIFTKDFTKQPSRDWILCSPNQEAFDAAITKLLVMPREDFLERNSEAIKYFMVPPSMKLFLEKMKEID
jgi:surface carbohydrate biosynthesis protein